MAGMIQYIDIASVLGADIIIGWIRGNMRVSKKAYNDVLGLRLKQLESYAKVKGIKILIEAINRYEIDSMSRAEEIMELIRDYRLTNTYVHLDTFHMNIEEVDIYGVVESCGDLLGYLHVADSNNYYPGAGNIDFESIFMTLRKMQYKGYVSVECLPYPDRLSAAENALRNIRNL